MSVILEHVDKSYGAGRRAVRDFSATIETGRLTVLVGPSGCGKTTVLRLIAGLEKPDGGTIWIDGRDVAGVPPRDRNVAMVFQNLAILSHLTVAENMGFSLALRKTPGAELARKVRGAAETLGLEGELDRYPADLSGGELQRVALGRAIVREPAVFLLDEPLSNLDAALRARMRVEIRKLQQRLSATMVFVTHDQEEAMTMADSVIVMRDGAQVQQDVPAGIYREPADVFTAGFIGSPPMNLVEGLMIKENGALVFRHAGGFEVELGAGYPDPGAGRNVVLGIRPEDVLVDRDTEAPGGVPAEVELAQDAGARTIVHVRARGMPLVVLSGGDTAPKTGDRVRLVMAPGRIRLFEPGGRRLPRAAGYQIRGA